MAVPGFGLGCWAFGGEYWPDQDREDSIKTIHAALRSGIRHFDTAQGYGKGRSEQILGQQLRRFRYDISRSEIRIASKLFMPPSPSQVPRLVETSLHRLCTEYLDIMYIHWPDSTKDFRPCLEQLDRIRDEGRIRAIGLSNFPEPLVRAALEVTSIEYCQIPLSLLWIRSLDALQHLCDSRRTKIVGYSPLGSGLLSGRYRGEQDLKAGDLRRRLFPLSEPYHAAFLELLARVEEVALFHETDMSTIALAWALVQPVDIVLTGSRTREQLTRALDATSCRLSEHSVRSLDAAAARLDACIDPEVDNPFFHRW